MQKIENKSIRRIFTLMVFIAFILTLSACGGKRTGSLAGISDEVYATSGKYTVSKKEVYEGLKYQKSGFTFLSPDNLKALEENLIFSPWLEAITFSSQTIINFNRVNDEKDDFSADDLNENERELKKLVDTACYGTDDVKKINEIPGAQRKTAEMKFTDSFINKGIITNIVYDLKIFETYKLELAKRNYAKAILEKEVTEEYLKDKKGKITDNKNSNYISQDDINTRFDTNYENRNPLSALIIRFANSEEANQTLRLFGDSSKIKYFTDLGYGDNYRGIKSYKNKWYLVPKASCYVGDDKTKPRECSVEDEKTFYDDYRVDTKDLSLDSIDGGKSLLIEFVKIYHYMYSYKTSITDEFIEELYNLPDLNSVVEKILKLGEASKNNTDYYYKDRFYYTYDELEKVNSSLRSYVYSSLMVTPDEDTTGIYRYTSSPRSYGENYYLMYKLEDQSKALLDEAIKNKIFDELFAEKLSSNYISEKVTLLRENITMTIFDPELETMYSLGNADYKKKKKKSNEFIAKIKVKKDEKLNLFEAEYNITPTDFFVEMEKSSGSKIAMSILSDKILKGPELNLLDRLTNEDIKDLKKSFESIMLNFSNDYFSSYGLPASIGRKQFMKLYFQADSLDEAFKASYESARALDYYMKDLLKMEGMNEKFAKYAQRLYTDYYDVTVSHFLIYIDMDEDGNPDDPDKYLDTLDAKEKEEYQGKVHDLMAKIVDFSKNSAQSHVTSFNEIIANLKDSTRYKPSEASCKKEPNQKSCEWAEYKQDGLLVKTEDIGSITNATSLNFDESFINQLLIMLDAENGKFQGQYLQEIDLRGRADDAEKTLLKDEKGNLIGYNSLTKSKFGWHLLLITSNQTAVSSQFLDKDDLNNENESTYNIIELFDEDGKYLETVNAYSTSHYPSINQIKIYMQERGYSNGIEHLPESVKSAMETWFKPVLDNYEGSVNNQFIFRSLLLKINNDEDNGISFSSSTMQNFYNRTYEVATLTFTEYKYVGKEDQNPYKDWFNDFFDYTYAFTLE